MMNSCSGLRRQSPPDKDKISRFDCVAKDKTVANQGSLRLFVAARESARYSAKLNSMLYPHSLLWHYLWVGPCVLLLILAVLSWRRQLHRIIPAFFVYMVFEGIQGLTMWGLDVAPRVSNDTYWRSDIVGLTIESLVKIAVLWELFSGLVRQRPRVASSGNPLIACTGAVLGLLAMMAAARAHVGQYAIMSHAQIFEQTIYMIETGVLLFLFLFGAHFHLVWDRRDFGIGLGLSMSACVGLGVSAFFANGIFFKRYYLLDFANMATYHTCVLIWYYFLLSPMPTRPNVAMPHNLASRSKLRSKTAPSVRQLLPSPNLDPCALD
jgi:hypothetical protein